MPKGLVAPALHPQPDEAVVWMAKFTVPGRAEPKVQLLITAPDLQSLWGAAEHVASLSEARLIAHGPAGWAFRRSMTVVPRIVLTHWPREQFESGRG